MMEWTTTTSIIGEILIGETVWILDVVRGFFFGVWCLLLGWFGNQKVDSVVQVDRRGQYMARRFDLSFASETEFLR